MSQPDAPKEPHPEVKEALARQIGALFLNFSGFEHTLNIALAAALGLSDFQERTLLRGMMTRPKLDLLESFAKKHWTDNAYADTKTVAKQARALTDFRNSIAHGMIVHDKEGEFQLITFRGENRFHGKIEPISPAIVGPHIDAAMRIAEIFQKLSDKLREEMRQRRDAQPKQHPPK
jgi:hypothetical protein